MRRSLLAALYFGLWTLVSATLAFANGVFESVRGDVKAAVGAATPASVAKNQRFIPGTTVLTGPGAQTVMRFDDGHAVVLNENTEFRVNQYSFDKDKPQSDNMAVQLYKGAMRSVSGLIGTRNRQAFALVNPAYLSVLQGTISATNAVGTATFGAGATATVASATALAVAIPASALPASVASTFGNLSSVAVGAAGAGAGAASGAAAGGITAGMVAAGFAVIGVAVAASNSNDNQTTATTTTVAH
jgi:hypothetical protein